MKTFLCLFVALLMPVIARSQEIPGKTPPIAKPLPHIVLISMGGTIASRSPDRMSITNYGGKELPRVDPGLLQLAHVEYAQRDIEKHRGVPKVSEICIGKVAAIA